MKKMLSILLALVLAAAALAACGSSGGSSSGTDESAGGSDRQNPVMNYVGYYVCGRASIKIGATDGENGADAFVSWSSSVAENSTWTMTGTFDPDEKRFEYHDCVRTDNVYGEDGEAESEEEVYTGGHGFMFFEDGEGGATLTWQDDQEHAADDMVFEYAVLPEGAEESGSAGMANPWQTADSLSAAAEGAGLDWFEISEGSEISLGVVSGSEYRYMDGIAEVYCPFPAVDMTIRKGRAEAASEDGDISGDYNTYQHEWTQNIKGLEVQCFGNREGEATKTIWQSGDMCYSILAYGAGGDDDFGLSADDLSSLINGIQ